MLFYSGVVLVSLLNCIVVLGHNQYKQLYINNPQQPTTINWLNPVDEVLSIESNDITLQFGNEFVKQITILKEYCERLGNEIEKNLEMKILQLSDYQAQINRLLNTEYRDMPNEDKQRVQDGFQTAFGNLFKEEKEKEEALFINCTNEFKLIMNGQMQKALKYAQAKLSTSVYEFVTLVNSVVAYNLQLQSALTLCMEMYNTNDYFKLVGSASKCCKESELQALMEFVDQFVVQAAGLLSSSDIQFEGSTRFEEIPPKIPETFPQSSFPDTPETPDTSIELINIEGTIDTVEDPTATVEQLDEFTEVPSDEPNDVSTSSQTGTSPSQDPNNHPHQSPNNHPHTPPSSDEPSTDTPTITDHTPPASDTSSDEQPDGTDASDTSSNEQPDGTDASDTSSNEQPDGTDASDTSSNEQPDGTDASDTSSNEQPDGTDASPTQNHFDVIIDDPAKPSDHTLDTTHSKHVFIATIVLGSVGAVIFCGIIIVGCLIVLIKYRKSRDGGWSRLTEEQKISIMKESGYINPTYKFFDQVTQ